MGRGGGGNLAGGKFFYGVLLCGGENLRRSEFDDLKLFLKLKTHSVNTEY